MKLIYLSNEEFEKLCVEEIELADNLLNEKEELTRLIGAMLHSFHDKELILKKYEPRQIR